MTKWWLKSKTEWAGLAAAVAVVVQFFTGQMWLDPQLQTSIVIFVMMALRFISNKGITLKR